MKCKKLGNHTISYQSLLLSTTVFNDIMVYSFLYFSIWDLPDTYVHPWPLGAAHPWGSGVISGKSIMLVL